MLRVRASAEVTLRVESNTAPPLYPVNRRLGILFFSCLVRSSYMFFKRKIKTCIYYYSKACFSMFRPLYCLD